MSVVKKKILVAVTNPNNRQPLQFLENANAVFYAATVVEAKTCLIRPMDLVICGLNFDDSRMFELLGHVKTLPSDHRPPVICLRQKAGKFDTTYESLIEKAITAQGVGEFFNLAKLVEAQGIDTASHMLLMTIDRMLERQCIS